MRFPEILLPAGGTGVFPGAMEQLRALLQGLSIRLHLALFRKFILSEIAIESQIQPQNVDARLPEDSE